ncbi:MAG: hypothetical protein DRO90_00195 [Candidatus Altiarchaeales archaeon]|nr:MAG: hypothetical protein DRO95_01895 [Candidatus Altiarchaeales archaeon]RLI95295.1 MAG: hypothetical protein DRO94_00870 [Candidatus Altiarchaeales archaeon]RLI95518.1 MAG: hypothetical protein DRO90_00195 [Candidatus Altiarchaeales archaeon]HDO82283.1 hypothetical protein [Candidatus Altiarchaeales archaeon]HEX54932.1 hypothetical protein [Candidatus Altiarchaeales archaeon]
MDLDEVIQKIDEKSEDYSIPTRIRNALKKVSAELKRDEQDLAVRVTSAIYELDDIVNDINIPLHAKTVIWDIISDLEAIREE